MGVDICVDLWQGIQQAGGNGPAAQQAEESTTMQFAKIKTALAGQFKKMEAHQYFRVKAEKDELWDAYLSSFPEGSNPIYRERTEHDCSCCRHFIRKIGGAVAVIDDERISVWDFSVDEPAYQAVADTMAELVKSRPIDNVFLSTERTAGVDKNFEDTVGGVATWEHFFVNLPPSCVASSTDIGPSLSDFRSRHDVLLRSLTEIDPSAVEAVLDLIAQNSIYRGEEHRAAVTQFKNLQSRFQNTENPDDFVWAQIRSVPSSVSKIRNTSIGTLLVDLSNGRPLEEAVKAFEGIVAPANYKRPTALVTKKMIEDAKSKLGELGLTSALERRYATLEDVSVNDILFVDRAARRLSTGDVFEEIATTVPIRSKSLDRVEEVPIDKFTQDILPTATSVEVLFENRHTNNLVSLIAPVDPTAGRIFKWGNLFSWSYRGDFADSIKERVKRAGGDVSGEFCCRLAWFNYDDLDLHMHEPNFEIYFGKKGPSPSLGRLDVDMNARQGCMSQEPVENIYYPSLKKMHDGTYHLFVHNYNKREQTNVGFEVEVDILGSVHSFVYDKPLKNYEEVTVARFQVKDGEVRIVESLPPSTASKKVWEVDTETFQKVSVIMYSPNYWEDHGVGNRHYFFMLDGCRNDGSARGFYNEFLDSALDPHRKVFEIVGAKMRTENAANQLSGLGFSSTLRNNLLVRVAGSFTRTVRVVF